MLRAFGLLMILLFSIHALAQRGRPIDPDATRETKVLFRSLRKLSKKHTLFGHQHATEYGRGWSGDPDRSDVKSVTGSHPAVIGVDSVVFQEEVPRWSSAPGTICERTLLTLTIAAVLRQSRGIFQILSRAAAFIGWTHFRSPQ